MHPHVYYDQYDCYTMRDRAGNISVRFLLLCINKCLSLEHRRLYVWGAVASHSSTDTMMPVAWPVAVVWRWCLIRLFPTLIQRISSMCVLLSSSMCCADWSWTECVLLWIASYFSCCFSSRTFFVSSVLKDTHRRERDILAFQISIYLGNLFFLTPGSIHQLTASCLQPLP